jgi:hypothetical protein
VDGDSNVTTEELLKHILGRRIVRVLFPEQELVERNTKYRCDTSNLVWIYRSSSSGPSMEARQWDSGFFRQFSQGVPAIFAESRQDLIELHLESHFGRMGELVLANSVYGM